MNDTQMRYRLLPTDVSPDRKAVKVVRYYDRSTRCWWAFPVNVAGDQLGDAQHDHFKDALSMDPAPFGITDMMLALPYEILSPDGLTREVWGLHDPRETGRVTIRSYGKQVRPTRRHGWKTVLEWHWAQSGRRTSLATVLDTHPPVSDDLKATLLTAWRNRYTLEV